MAMRSTHNTPPNPSTVEDISTDYGARRAALVRALTHDVDQVYNLCDPEEEKFLCLYGLPDGRWEVSPPSETVPPTIPDPTLGINLGRDALQRNDWLCLLAIHSDSWLYNLAFFYAAYAYLNASERLRLFNSINSLPTVFEVVSEWKYAQNKPNKGKSSEASGSKSKDKGKRSEASGGKSKDKNREASGSKSKDKGKRSEASGGKSKDKNREASGSKSKGKNIEASGSRPRINLNSEEDKDTKCGSCGKLYQEDEFWIACDFCQVWYHGECVNVTPEMAENVDKYQCPFACYCREKIN